jgi:uncharacterized protein (DUF1778 family)
MAHSQQLRNPNRHAHYASGKALSSAKMLAMAKRTLQINVRMSNEDLALLQKAAATLWPGVELTTSTIVLSLAKKSAEEVLHPARKPK